MSCGHSKKCKTKLLRIIALIMLLIIVLPLTFSLSGSANVDSKRSADPNESAAPNTGFFRIRNLASGMYMTVYMNSSRGLGRLYAAPLDIANQAQIFSFEQKNDDSFVLWPQNDTGLYCISWQDGTSSGSDMKKSLSESEQTRFDIFKLKNGSCTIAPSGGDNIKAVLGESKELSYYSDYYIQIQNYEIGNPSQQWILEPIKTEKITLAFSNTTVKRFSTGKFYARLFPYNFSDDRVRWTSDNEDVLMLDDDGRYCALSCGTARITVTAGEITASATVNVTDKSAFTWYSQRSVANSDWNATLLHDLYFWADGLRLRYFVDAKAMSAGKSWMNEGCALCSVAMVLHNIGATLEKGYDLRSGQAGNLPADPYTTSLANTHNFGESSVNELLYGDPILVNWNVIANRFFVDGKPIVCRKVYNPSLRTIANLLNEHPGGLVVQLSSKKSDHFVVFAECLNPEATLLNDLKFIVYDPLGYTEDLGDGVLFERSAACLTAGFSKWSVVSVMIYDLAEKFNN